MRRGRSRETRLSSRTSSIGTPSPHSRSFIRKSAGRTNPEGEDSENYIEGGTIDYKNLNGGHRGQGTTKQSQITEEQIEIDYDMERKIML
jgi:hypothetical protein